MLDFLGNLEPCSGTSFSRNVGTGSQKKRFATHSYINVLLMSNAKILSGSTIWRTVIFFS